MGRILPIVLVVMLVAGAVLEPGWPLRALDAALWLGGWWRALAVPLVLASVAILLATNLHRPGSAWACVGRAARALRRPAPAVLALLVAATSVGLLAGLLRVRSLLESVYLFALQLALFPGTPLLGLCLVLAVVVVALDRRGAVVLHLCVAAGARWGGPLQRAAPRVLAPLGAAVAAGILAAALFPAALQAWNRPDPDNARQFNYYSAFFNYALQEDGNVESLAGFGLGKFGLTLAPGASGAIVYRLERPADSIVLLKANFYNRPLSDTGAALLAGEFPNRFELAAGDGPYHTVFADTSIGEIVGNQVVDLTPLVGDARIYRLRFAATNTAAADVTVLPSVVVSTVVDPAATPGPLAPVVFYSAAVAVALALSALALTGRPQFALLAGATGGASLALAARIADAVTWGAPASSAGAPGTLAAVLFDPTPAPPVNAALAAARAVACVTALGWLAYAASRRRDGSRAFAGGAVVACLLVSALAFDVRWDELNRVRYETLLPDAQGYQAIAAEFPLKMAHYRAERFTPLLDQLYAAGFDGKASAAAVFYAGGNNGREPGWPVALRLVFNLLGVSAFHTRLTSLLLGTALVGLTCWFGWRLLHPLVGITGAVLLAVSRPHVVNNVGGLREEEVGVLFLLLVAALFVGAQRSGTVTWQRAAAAGAAAAGVILVRADMLVLGGTAITLAALWLRWPWRKWVLSLVVLGALAGPMYLGYAFTHHDAFYPGTYGATVNRNLEFPERMGTPGFPSPDEYAANWAAGPTISPTTYFFGYHTIPQFLDYMVRGFIRIFPTVLFRDAPVPLALCVAGSALLLLSRRWLIPAAIVVSLVPFYAFMAGVPNPWVFAPRYAHHVYPFAVLAAGYAVWAVPLWLASRFGLARRMEDSPAAPPAPSAPGSPTTIAV